jgi:uncharacterized membrane protein
MIIMALDHTRDFISYSAQVFAPEDLTRTTAALFFTRWITHFCAPTFALTTGIGAYLWLGSSRTIGQLSRFLFTRGLWLLFLEVTAMRFAYGFNFTYQPVFLLVFWSLGCSMIWLSLVARLPLRALAIISVATILIHNLFDPIRAGALGSWGWLWHVLHQPGIVAPGGMLVLVAYPLIPWLDVVSAGFCFGWLVKQRRTDMMIRIGAGMTLAFIALRSLHLYGDPRPWSGGFLSFLNCTKYPPSLEFLLMTLGPAILVLAWFDRFKFSDRNPLIVFGRVPLFFFVLHFFAIHLTALVLAWLRYGTPQSLLRPLPTFGGPDFPGYGYSLPVVCLVWAGIVIAFYPLCRWFASVKARRTDWWLSYL